jgi:hypothetical protein
MIYLVTLPIIIYLTLSITLFNTKIQVWKKNNNLDYPRYFEDVSLLRFFFSKVLNCSFCLSGHISWITLLIAGYSIICIIPLTIISMYITEAIENYIIENHA